MSIDFSLDRWEKIRENYELWWNRKLERPIVAAVLSGKDPGRIMPAAPLLSQKTCADLSFSADDVIDRIDFELSTQVFLGDAFPFVNMHDFGPGVAAAFLGADLDNRTGNVWFAPKEILPINELHFEFDPNNQWLCRIKDIYSAGMKRWRGQVLMGMTDLGGAMDILSTFRPSENLLYDLYDNPGEVKRLTLEIHGLWHRFYLEFAEILAEHNPGHSDWSQIYSASPTYPIQCDFSYMISPAMFDEFALPELEATCKKLTHSLYHLDGVGELPHLDSLLKIKELDAVQWIPGDGKPDASHWPEIHRKIHAAGKNIYLRGEFDCLDRVAGQIGTYKGIFFYAKERRVSQEAEVRAALARF